MTTEPRIGRASDSTPFDIDRHEPDARCMTRYCGKPTGTLGHLCRWRVSRADCQHHYTPRGAGLTEGEVEERERAMAPAPVESGATETAVLIQPLCTSDAITRRDIGEVCWLIVERALTEGGTDGKGASVAVSALRILVGLPPAGKTAEAARKEAFLRGKVMHGIAPQSPEEWALAEEIFEEKAIEEFQRWELWERDDGYVDEPLALGDFAGDEPQAAALVDQED